MAPPGSLPIPRSPPGGAAEPRRRARLPAPSPGQRVLTWQGGDAAEVVIASATVVGGTEKKRESENAGDARTAQTLPRQAFLLLGDTWGLGLVVSLLLQWKTEPGHSNSSALSPQTGTSSQGMDL